VTRRRAVQAQAGTLPLRRLHEAGPRDPRADWLAAGGAAVDENHFGVEIPDGRFLDAAGPHGNYQFKRYGPVLVEDCPCGCQPDDGDHDAARRLLFTLGIHPEPKE
jgi:hypothetical protein